MTEPGPEQYGAPSQPPAQPPVQPPAYPQHTQPPAQPAAQQPADAPSGTNQVVQGMKQMGAGVGDIFGKQITPAVSSGMQNLQANVKQISSSKTWYSWVPLAIPAAALLGLLSLFFPIMKASSAFGDSESMTIFSEDAEKSGLFVVFLFILAAAFAIVSLAVSAKWAQLTSGIVSVVVGVILAWNGFSVVSMISTINSAFGGFANFKVGFATVMLIITGLILLAAGVISLLVAVGQIGGGGAAKVAAPGAGMPLPGAPAAPAAPAATPAMPAPVAPVMLPADTDAQTLYQYATNQPEYRVAVAAHPNAYPDLLTWLGSLGDPAVNEALANRPPAN